MTRFFKNHEIISIILAFSISILFYSTAVVVQAYIDTPEIIGKILSSDKMVLQLEDLSIEFQDSLLKVEDPKFYSHNGIDLTTPGG